MSSASGTVTSFWFTESSPRTSGCSTMLYRVPETMARKTWPAGALLTERSKRGSGFCVAAEGISTTSGGSRARVTASAAGCCKRRFCAAWSSSRWMASSAALRPCCGGSAQPASISPSSTASNPCNSIRVGFIALHFFVMFAALLPAGFLSTWGCSRSTVRSTPFCSTASVSVSRTSLAPP